MKEHRGTQLGFIYVLTNKAMRNLVKIGCSQKNPHLRKAELESTGVPAPFDLEYFAVVHDFQASERKLHRDLSEFRYSTNREFFQLSAFDAVKHVQEILSDDIIHENFSETYGEQDGKIIISSEQRELLDLCSARIEFYLRKNGCLTAASVRFEQNPQAPRVQLCDLDWFPLQQVISTIKSSLNKNMVIQIEEQVRTFHRLYSKISESLKGDSAREVRNRLWISEKDITKRNLELSVKVIFMRKFMHYYREYINDGKELNLNDYVDIEFERSDKFISVAQFPCVEKFSVENFEQTPWIYVGYMSDASKEMPFYETTNSYDIHSGKKINLPIRRYGFLIHPFETRQVFELLSLGSDKAQVHVIDLAKENEARFAALIHWMENEQSS